MSGKAWAAAMRSNSGVLMALSVVGFLIYSNTFHNSFHFDDWATIVDNKAIRDLGEIKIIWEAFNTRFIVGLSFALNYAIGKLNVSGYHLFNIVLHILSSFLVFVLLILIFKTPRMVTSPLAPYGRLLGFLSALVFLVHPIQTQAVTYIWQRAASLATFFYLTALICFMMARLKNSYSYYLASLGITVVDMFTKEIAFTLPLALIMLDFTFCTNPITTRKKENGCYSCRFL